MIRTPKTKMKYIVSLTVLYIIHIVFTLLHNATVIRSIARPDSVPETSLMDSLIIVFSIKEQLLFLVVLILLLIPSIIKYKGNVSLVAWQRNRPVWSIAWSLLYISLASVFIYDIVRIYIAVHFITIENIIGTTAMIFILLFARSEVVSIPNNGFKFVRVAHLGRRKKRAAP